MSHLKSLGVLSIFLFLIISVCALQENFEAYNQIQGITSCINTHVSDSIIIKNTGDVLSTYSVSGNTATYSENSFTLNPGETKTIFVYYNFNQKGTYSSQTTIKTSFGLQKTVNQVINVQNCANIFLNVRNPAIKVNPCQAAQYIFDIRNTGSSPETYDFGIKGMEQYSVLSANSVMLAPGDSTEVYLFVNPECDVYGQKKIEFYAQSRTNQFLAKADLILDIARTYDYEVQIPKQITICNLKASEIPIVIKNNVKFANQYDISISGPSWLNQEARRVELYGMKTGITNVIASPANPGSFIAEYVLKSTRGDVIKGGLQNITVEKCYANNVNIDSPSDIIVSGHSNQYQVTVKNEGTKTDKYNFELNSPEWISSDFQPITLNPKESKTFNLKASYPNKTGNFKASVKLISLETNTAREDSIEIEVISLEEAFKLEIGAKNTRILYGQDVVNVELENKGTLPATYDLSLKSQPWLKLTAASVTLKPNQKAIIPVQADTTKKVEQANYETQITAAVRGEAIGFTSTFNIKLKELTVGQELYLFSLKYWILIAISAAIIVILLFIKILGKRIARKWRNWRIKRQEIAKVKAELRQRKKEEKLARKLLKKSLKQKVHVSIWKRILGIFFVLVAVILLVGAVLAITGYAPFVNELMKQKPINQFEPIITVDTTGLEAFGNTVIVRGETQIPIIIKNNYDEPLLFYVQTKDSWVRTDTKQIELESKEEETINIIVTPQEDTKGIYKILVSTSLEKDNKLFTEEITLNIRQKNLIGDLLNYVWYFVVGLAILIIAMIFIKPKKRKLEIKKTEFKKHEGFSKIKYIPERNIDIKIEKNKK